MSEPRFDGQINDDRNRPSADVTDRQSVPPELKAIEAELAMLAPRDDRMNRERLLFLAGQASVRDTAVYQKASVRRWIWPASFAAMTTVAAALFAMLLVQPEPEAVERIVYVPAKPLPASVPDETDAVHDVEQRGRAKHGRIASSGDAFSYGLAATQPSLRGSLPAGGPQFRLFDHLYAEASYAQLRRETPLNDADEPASRPVLSRWSLTELLEESATQDVPSDWPTYHNPGAKS